MKLTNRSGAAIAVTAAVLFPTGAALAPAAHAGEAKGQSARNSASHSNAQSRPDSCDAKQFWERFSRDHG